MATYKFSGLIKAEKNLVNELIRKVELFNLIYNDLKTQRILSNSNDMTSELDVLQQFNEMTTCYCNLIKEGFEIQKEIGSAGGAQKSRFNTETVMLNVIREYLKNHTELPTGQYIEQKYPEEAEKYNKLMSSELNHEKQVKVKVIIDERTARNFLKELKTINWKKYLA